MSLLTVKNLYKNFEKTEVLKGISFSMEQGEVIAIIGSSGSGKTTLLRCLNFLETANGGSIELNGDVLFDAKDKSSLSDERIRQNRLHFGLVFQQFNLFPQYNVFENICLAPKLLARERKDFKSAKKEIYNEIEANASSLLERVGLTEKAKNYPCELSGGQQQRVAIARALALQPEILFFDEPTSALDPELTGEVLKTIKDLKDQGKTMVLVTHEMSFARNVADRIIFMADGVIEEEGAPEELFTAPKSEKTRKFLNKSDE